MTEKPPTTVPCSRCTGSGREPLSDVHGEILQELERQEASASDLERTTGASHTAINNRLEWLRLHGLATRRKAGREWVYTAVAAPAAKKRASAA
jgi:DNA-binding transcriptional ArsR family regulator